MTDSDVPSGRQSWRRRTTMDDRDWSGAISLAVIAVVMLAYGVVRGRGNQQTQIANVVTLPREAIQSVRTDQRQETISSQTPNSNEVDLRSPPVDRAPPTVAKTTDTTLDVEATANESIAVETTATKQQRQDTASESKPSVRLAMNQTSSTEATKGRVRGKIETGHTMRGTLVLTSDTDSSFSSNIIEIASANPAFEFAEVPPGMYSLIFKGTVNYVRRGLTWRGLMPDTPGGKQYNSLSPNDAVSK